MVPCRTAPLRAPGKARGADPMAPVRAHGRRSSARRVTVVAHAVPAWTPVARTAAGRAIHRARTLGARPSRDRGSGPRSSRPSSSPVRDRPREDLVRCRAPAAPPSGLANRLAASRPPVPGDGSPPAPGGPRRHRCRVDHAHEDGATPQWRFDRGSPETLAGPPSHRSATEPGGSSIRSFRSTRGPGHRLGCDPRSRSARTRLSAAIGASVGNRNRGWCPAPHGIARRRPARLVIVPPGDLDDDVVSRRRDLEAAPRP